MSKNGGIFEIFNANNKYLLYYLYLLFLTRGDHSVERVN